MTIQLGETGKAAYGPLKTFNITLATPRETLLGSPVSLPISEIAGGSSGAQISYTIQSSDLPTINPNPLSVKYTASLYVGGKNTDAASQSVSYHLYKNGTSVAPFATQSPISSNNFWTQQHAQFFGVSAGDTLSVSLWASSTNVNYDYYALVIHPTQINLGKAYINKDVSYSNYVKGTLTQGTPAVQVLQNYNLYPSDSPLYAVSTSNAMNFGALKWNPTLFSGRVQYGDTSTQTNTATHASNRPYYSPNQLPATISFREVLR